MELGALSGAVSLRVFPFFSSGQRSCIGMPCKGSTPFFLPRMPLHSEGKGLWIFSPFAFKKNTKALPEESHRGVLGMSSGISA